MQSQHFPLIITYHFKISICFIIIPFLVKFSEDVLFESKEFRVIDKDFVFTKLFISLLFSHTTGTVFEGSEDSGWVIFEVNERVFVVGF